VTLTWLERRRTARLIIFISHDTNVLHEPAHDLHRDEPQVTTDLEFEKKSVPWQLVMLAPLHNLKLTTAEEQSLRKAE